MTKSLVYGPNGTSVAGVTTGVTFALPALNYEADFRCVDDTPGNVKYVDITAPTDQLSMLRIAQKARPNVYAGSSIDPSVFLPNKAGIDTVSEITGIVSEVDSSDSTYLRQFPFRAAVTITVPLYSAVTADVVKTMVGRAVAGLFATPTGNGEIDKAGLEAILHGSLVK